MAIARLHGGPLDGQVLPLDDETQSSLILPYSQTQLVYERGGALEDTGTDDGPTAANFHFVEAEDDVNPDVDGRDE